MGYLFKGRSHPQGARMHGENANKKAMAPLHDTINFTPGVQAGLGLLYNIFLRIFKSNIAPQAGNEDQIRGALVNLLVYAYKINMKEEKRPVNVMNFIYEDMSYCIHNKKIRPYAPYVMMLLISRAGVTPSEGTTEHMLGYIQKKPTSTQRLRCPIPYPGPRSGPRPRGPTRRAD